MPEATKLIDEVKQVVDITSRVDERVKMIAEAQHYMNSRLNHFIDEYNALVPKVKINESIIARHEVLTTDLAKDVNGIRRRLLELERHKKDYVTRVNLITGYVFQAIFLVAVCYLLYRLGLNPPPVP